MRVNRIAKRLTLTLEHPIIHLDKHGGLLWFLAETLDLNYRDARSSHRVSVREVRLLIGKFFVDAAAYERLANPYLQVWPTHDVVDTVYAGVFRRQPRAMLVLFGLISPYWYPQQKQYLEELMASRGPVTVVLRRVRRRVHAVYNVISFTAYLLVLVTSVAIVAWIFMRSSETRLLFDTIMGSDSPRSFSDIFKIVTIIANPVMVAVVFLTRRRRDVMLKILNRVISVIFPPLEDMGVLLQKERFYRDFRAAVRDEFSKNEEAWVPLLTRSDQMDIWRNLVLSWTRTPDDKVIEVVLRSLQNTTIPRDIRVEFLRWACLRAKMT